jgi:hypothetical protein
MRAFVVRVIAVAAVTACSKSIAPPTSAPAPAIGMGSTPTTARIMVRVGDSFSPQGGPQALKAFVAEVQPEESGGECTVLRTTGNGALTVTASYPLRTAAKSTVTVTFDSAGHVARYSETRGVVRFKTTGVKPEQVDSARRAAEAAIRTTSVTFDYAIDQAIAMNRGGGKPTVAVIGTVRELQNLEQLASPVARMERMRKLCGV